MNKAPAKQEIIGLEKDFWDAIQRKDGKRTSELMGTVALTIGARGVASIPRGKMAELTAEGKWTLDAYHFDNIEVVTPTPDVAIIAYVVNLNVTMDGKQQVLRAADSSAWVRSDNGWQCHTHSETLLN